jgi:hypothetical protein
MKTPVPRNLNQFIKGISPNSTRFTKSLRPTANSAIRNMSTSGLNIENTNINTAPDVDLSSQQKTIVGSVLDLFAGRPSLEKLQLWSDEGVFEDPITIARGRKQFEPQWVRPRYASMLINAHVPLVWPANSIFGD